MDEITVYVCVGVMLLLYIKSFLAHVSFFCLWIKVLSLYSIGVEKFNNRKNLRWEMKSNLIILIRNHFPSLRTLNTWMFSVKIIYSLSSELYTKKFNGVWNEVQTNYVD